MIDLFMRVIVEPWMPFVLLGLFLIGRLIGKSTRSEAKLPDHRPTPRVAQQQGVDRPSARRVRPVAPSFTHLQGYDPALTDGVAPGLVAVAAAQAERRIRREGPNSDDPSAATGTDTSRGAEPSSNSAPDASQATSLPDFGISDSSSWDTGGNGTSGSLDGGSSWSSDSS